MTDRLVLLLRLSVPAAIAVFGIVFFMHIRGMTLLSTVFPLVLIAGLLFILLPAIVWSELRAYRRERGTPALTLAGPQAEWLVLIVVGGLLVAWAAIFEGAGFYIASGAVYLGVSLILMKRSPSNILKVVLVAGLFLFCMAVLFDDLLGVPLPRLTWG